MGVPAYCAFPYDQRKTKRKVADAVAGKRTREDSNFRPIRSASLIILCESNAGFLDFPKGK
jgi:hypothetical protein